MITSLICFSILTIPTLWELIDDRHGETLQEKKKDVYRRLALIVLFSFLSVFIRHITFRINDGVLYQGLHVHDTFLNLLFMFVKSCALSFAIFFLVFDYAINLILGRKPWYKYLSKSPIDKAWSGWSWKWRMVVRIVIFVSALTWFLWKTT